MLRRLMVLALLGVGCDAPQDSQAPGPRPDPPLVTLQPEAPPPEEPEDFSTPLGWFETKFQPVGNRGKNVIRAATLVATVRLRPSQEFSFNERVGHRTVENGFFFAPVILKGEMDMGLGGGVCQVSSTLHAAALMAGLDVVQRTAHSRPTKYMAPGLDAMVSLPDSCVENACESSDLRIRNSLSFPIQLVVSVKPPEKKWALSDLRVDVLGRGDPPPRPSYSFSSVKTRDFEQRSKTVEGKPAGYRKQVQKGIPGMRVTSRLKVGDRTVRSYTTTYPPTDEIWEVSAEDLDQSTPPSADESRASGGMADAPGLGSGG